MDVTSDSDSTYGFMMRNISEYTKFAGSLGEAICAGFKPHRIAPHVGPQMMPKRIRRMRNEDAPIHYQGNPCKRGHTGLRMISSNDCVECRKMRAEQRNIERRGADKRGGKYR